MFKALSFTIFKGRVYWALSIHLIARCLSVRLKTKFLTINERNSQAYSTVGYLVTYVCWNAKKRHVSLSSWCTWIRYLFCSLKWFVLQRESVGQFGLFSVNILACSLFASQRATSQCSDCCSVVWIAKLEPVILIIVMYHRQMWILLGVFFLGCRLCKEGIKLAQDSVAPWKRPNRLKKEDRKRQPKKKSTKKGQTIFH